MEKFDAFINKINNIKLRWYHFVLIFLISFFVIVARRPDVIFQPQFWAEDGLWFSDAYNNWLQAFFMPHTGYFQTLPRIVAAVAQMFSLSFAPWLFNFAAIIIKILPILFIFSERFKSVIQKVETKILLAIIYLLLPNTFEIYANLTNAQWYLSVLALMIIVAPVSAKLWWKIVDAIVLLIAGLSGPFVFIFLPIIIFKKFVLKQSVSFASAAIIFVSFILQAGAMLSNASTRVHSTLGATLAAFVKIISGQIFLGAIFGKNGYSAIYSHFLATCTITAAMIYSFVFLVGLYILIFATYKGSWHLRLFNFFCWSIFFAALLSPMASTAGNQWQVMLLPGNATRYWFLPMLSFVVSVVTLLQLGRWSKRIVTVILIMMIIGIKMDLILPKWIDLKFGAQAQEFQQLPSGTEYKFDIQPANMWQMKLRKK